MSIALRTVGIIVKDMPKTLAFYRALGLAIPEDADSEETSTSSQMTASFSVS